MAALECERCHLTELDLPDRCDETLMFQQTKDGVMYCLACLAEDDELLSDIDVLEADPNVSGDWLNGFNIKGPPEEPYPGGPILVIENNTSKCPRCHRPLAEPGCTQTITGELAHSTIRTRNSETRTEEE